MRWTVFDLTSFAGPEMRGQTLDGPFPSYTIETYSDDVVDEISVLFAQKYSTRAIREWKSLAVAVFDFPSMLQTKPFTPAISFQQGDVALRISRQAAAFQFARFRDVKGKYSNRSLVVVPEIFHIADMRKLPGYMKEWQGAPQIYFAPNKERCLLQVQVVKPPVGYPKLRTITSELAILEKLTPPEFREAFLVALDYTMETGKSATMGMP